MKSSNKARICDELDAKRGEVGRNGEPRGGVVATKITKRKSSCAGCRALDKDHCTLGYPIEWKFICQGIGVPWPLTQCPQPKTYMNLNTALKDRETWAYNACEEF